MHNGETWILVDSFDRQELLTQLDRLLDDADLQDQLGQAAWWLISENYDLKTRCLPRQINWFDAPTEWDDLV